MLSAIAVCGCAPPNEYQPPKPPVVEVATPLVETVTSFLEETGTTEAVGMVKIRARVRGFIEEIRFKTDEDVKAGNVLYVIEKPTYEAARDKAKADVATALAEYENADAQYRAEVPLLEKGLVPREQVEQRKAERSVAQAAVYAAQATLKEKEIDLGYCEITTPIDGRVGKTLVKKGNLVDGSEGTHLTTVINYDDIYANFYISERVLQQIKQNSPRRQGEEINKEEVKMYLAREIDGDEFPYEGHLDYWDLAVEESTGTYAIRGIFENPNRDLIPGMTVKIRVPMRPIENALLVPERSIGVDQTGRYVLVVNNENIVKRKSVTVGDRFGDLQVITEGLTKEDRVVVDGLQRARLDAQVDPKPHPKLELKTDGLRVLDDASGERENLPAPQPEVLDESAAAVFDGDADPSPATDPDGEPATDAEGTPN